MVNFVDFNWQLKNYYEMLLFSMVGLVISTSLFLMGHIPLTRDWSSNIAYMLADTSTSA